MHYHLVSFPSGYLFLRIFLIFLILVLGAAIEAHARPVPEAPRVSVELHERAGTEVRTDQGGVSLDEAVARVRRRYGGEVIKAETRGDVHHIKILKEGRVRTVRVDARTGRIR